MHRSRLPFWPVLLALPLSAFLTFAAEEKTVVNREAVDAVKQMLEIKLGSAATAEKQYVGTDACLSCHTNLKDFKKSLHHTGLKTAPNDKYSMQIRAGVIADYDRNKIDDFKQGLDFNKISSVFDKYKPNAPILGYSADKGYTMTIAGVEYKIAVIHGGSGLYKQRFLTRLNVTDIDGGLTRDLYYSPVQYNEMTGSYVLYSTDKWYNADNTPKLTKAVTAKEAAAIGKSFNKDCTGCHVTNFYVTQDPNNEWITQVSEAVYYPAGEPPYIDINQDGYAEMHNIGCERCHGPGSVHITNLGSAKDILNPERDFDAKQKNELCGSCHSRGTSADGKHEYPLSADGDDYARHLGEPLYTKFWTDKPGLWPDNKTSRQHHQQLQDLMKSSKWEYRFHKVYCAECHDPHAADPGQIRKEMTVDGAAGAKLKLKVAVEDNSLCLACHAGFGPFATLTREMVADMEKNRDAFASVTTAHSNHPYNPEGGMGLSRCTECHMAKMAASGDPYDMSSHTFEVVPGEKTLTYQDKGGMPNSCAVRCHRVLAPIYGQPVDLSLSTWTENSDKELSTWLSTYYGKNGVWWKTK